VRRRLAAVAGAVALLAGCADGGTDDGAAAAAVSAGSPQSPSHNGPHVVNVFRREMIMDSSTYGMPVAGRTSSPWGEWQAGSALK
jgi:hypothetical protein